MAQHYDYLLGDARPEALRLQEQAELWDPISFALFDRIALRPGSKVLEVGPGPGSVHLELRRRVKAAVDAVERSLVFSSALQERCKGDGFGPGHFWESDLIDTPLPSSHYDLIFARWVFLFLPDPQRHIEKLAEALKPGGLLVIQDYYRDTLGMVPRPAEWANFLVADQAFFASQGGDASIAARLPELYRAAGLTMVDAHAEIKSGKPGSAVWKWLSDYFLNVLGRYAMFTPFDAGQAASLRKAWERAADDKTSLLIAPTVVGLVGRKRTGEVADA